MTPLEYLKTKNELVFKVTGKVLIPDDQLIEHELNDEAMSKFIPHKLLNSDNCTYCLKHYPTCHNCPMSTAGNWCFYAGSTYQVATDAWNKLATSDDRQRLYNLDVKFKESYK